MEREESATDQTEVGHRSYQPRITKADAPRVIQPWDQAPQFQVCYAESSPPDYDTGAAAIAKIVAGIQEGVEVVVFVWRAYDCAGWLRWSCERQLQPDRNGNWQTNVYG